MKLVEFVPPRPHPLWKLCLQMGITDVIVKVMDHDPERVIADLSAAGLRVVGFEGDMFDMSPIKEGLPNRDEAIAKYLKYLELMAKHGIRLLCYNFMGGTGWARTGVREGRGGAKATKWVNLVDANYNLTYYPDSRLSSTTAGFSATGWDSRSDYKYLKLKRGESFVGRRTK